MKTLFPPSPVVTVPVAGTDALFPVRRIWCVGRNYAAHAREMGADPEREAPFFFAKPADSVVVVPPGQTVTIPHPPQSSNVHHEIELVAAIGPAPAGCTGRDIPVERALQHVVAYAVGLDMTRRDLQQQAKDKGRPWEMGKSYDHSAPIGPLHLAAEVGHLPQGAIWLTVDGQPRQRSDVSQLIWSVAEVVANLSTFVALEPGDLIYTGTPEGVGRVGPGQAMHGGVDGLGEIRVRVAG